MTEYRRKIENRDITVEIEQISKGQDIQYMESKIRESKYCKESKGWLLEEENGTSYLKSSEERERNNLRLIARARMGNGALSNQYWKTDNMCRLCKEESETMEHVLADCRKGIKNKNWKEALNRDGKKVAWLLSHTWKKQKAEEEEYTQQAQVTNI